jgi:hypothetical protein
MNEDDSRLLRQHVTVDRGHLDAVLAQRAENVGHLRADQHKIAGDRGLAASGRLEADPARAAYNGRTNGMPSAVIGSRRGILTWYMLPLLAPLAPRI